MEPNMNQMNSITFAEIGIKRETIVPYTSEENEIVEWKNRTIMEATHAMLHD